MPNPILEDSTVPTNDKVLQELGLVSRAWLNFFLWIKRRIIALGQGPMQVTQAQIAGMGLNSSNVGFLIWVTNYNHLLRWSGTAWDFAPGYERSNWYALFEATGPQPPMGSGWVLADGSTVNVLNADGTITSVTIQTIADTYFRI